MTMNLVRDVQPVDGARIVSPRTVTHQPAIRPHEGNPDRPHSGAKTTRGWMRGSGFRPIPLAQLARRRTAIKASELSRAVNAVACPLPPA